MEKMELPKLQIGAYSPKYPIIQGGMGVMVSGPRLAGAVAAEGGVGTIASVGLAAAAEGESSCNSVEGNASMIKKFIAQAREKAKGGVLAINCMCALTDYEQQVRAACEAACGSARVRRAFTSLFFDEGASQNGIHRLEVECPCPFPSLRVCARGHAPAAWWPGSS